MDCLRQNLFADQLDYFDTQIRVSLVSLTLISVIVTFLFWEIAGLMHALVWLGSSICVIVLRLYISHSYRQKHSPDRNELYHRLFFLGVFLTSTVWLVGTFIFFSDNSFPHQIFLAFIYSGVTAGSLSTLGVRKEFFTLYLSFLLLPLVYLLWNTHDALAVSMAWLIAIYLLFMLSVGINYYKLITNSIMVKHENAHLIDELQVSKEMAENATRMKSQFLANMSHEVRTPLNGVIGLTELLMHTELDSKQQAYMQRIKSSSQSLLHVINDILDFSKIEAGRLDLEEKNFNLDEVLQTIQNTFEHQIEQKGVAFILNNETGHLRLKGDPLRLTQILTNLTSNAMKFIKEGRITLSCSIIDEDEGLYRLQFSVKDSGIGIPEEALGKLFTSFTQADASTTREFGGTGLGLTISKQLTEMMNGKIWVKSEPGVGSEFFFTAVFHKVLHDDMPGDGPLEAGSRTDLLKQLDILVAEDNKTNQLVVMGMLEEYVNGIDFAGNGEEAVAMVEKGDYDLVLMDIQMPVMGGYEASGIIKQTHPDLPVIALTANAMKADIEKTKKEGMQGHITKPIDVDQMLDTIISVMQGRYREFHH